MMRRKIKDELKPNVVTDDTKKSIITRTITAVVFLLIVVPCIFLGGWFYFALIFALTGIGAFEIIRASKPLKSYKVILYIFTIIFVYIITFWIFFRNNTKAYIDAEKSLDTFDIKNILTNSFDKIEVSTLFLLVAAGFYLMLTFFRNSYTISHAFYYFGMILILGLSFQSFLYVRYMPFGAFANSDIHDTFFLETSTFKYGDSALLVAYILIGVCFDDVGAYFVGILFGKHKINPRISPKKTWEGFAGGVLISWALSMTFAFVLAATDHPILPIFTLDKWYWIILTSLIIPFAADLGDFIFSAIKRYFNIKDYGNILPGHGGILDRFDSILIAASAVAILTQLISTGFGFKG